MTFVCYFEGGWDISVVDFLLFHKKLLRMVMQLKRDNWAWDAITLIIIKTKEIYRGPKT